MALYRWAPQETLGKGHFATVYRVVRGARDRRDAYAISDSHHPPPQ